MTDRPRPTRLQLLAAQDRTIPDVLAADLRVLFCGINPSLYSAVVGHHFARPGNRFWRALAESGLTPRRFDPFEDATLPALGLGLTNLVARASGAADVLTRAELIIGGERLERLVGEITPERVAFVGITAYRTAFGRPHAQVGPQAERVGTARVWVLPNPSGRNVSFSVAPFRALAEDLRIR